MKRIKKLKRFIRKTIWTGKFLYKVIKLVFGLLRDLSEHADKQPGDPMSEKTQKIEEKKWKTLN